MPTPSHDFPPFPPDFLFGAATSDHQCEAYVPEYEDVRDVWERVRGLVPRGRATDFWERYPDDIALAQRLGCRLFRFSVAWARVEPRPGEWNAAALDHYARLAQAARAAGLQPLVTLHHFTWPVHLEAEGGLLADDFPARFAEYARRVAERLGPDVPFWITFNEPTLLILGYLKPWWEPNYYVPPGLPEGASWEAQVQAVGQAMRNLFRAHALARRAIHAVNPQAQVGANPALLGFPAWLQRLLDWNATRVRTPNDLARQGRRFARPARLDHGAVDLVIAALSVTPDRTDQALFSQPYLVTGQTLMVRTSSPVTRVEDIAGHSIAVVAGTTAERDIGRLLPHARPLVVPDYPAALAALDSGEAEAVLADEVILRALVARRVEAYRFVGGLLTEERYIVAAALGNTELLDGVDLAIRAFKTARLAEGVAGLADLGAIIPPPTARSLADLNPALSTHDASRSTPRAPRPDALTIAVRDDIPGLAYRDPHTGEWSGLEIDLARQIAQTILGDASRVRFRVAPPAQRLPLLRSAWRWLDPWLKAYSTVSTILTSNWWHLGMAGRLAPFLCPPECAGQQDYVGFDYYWGVSALRLDRVQRLLDAAGGRFDRAPVWPGALYDMLRYHARLFPHLPLLIVENGCVEEADGVTRAAYLRDHLAQVSRAVRDGVNLAGYVCWSITSNREWGLPFSPASDFGLYHIALDTDPALTRHPTEAAEVYRAVIQGNRE
ncbi:MAG: family 1 glycosylhydrolase [Anaerolineae bacterium]|nr:family 1 glycosylhydrolase [Anaerolineae bacterium]